MRLGLFFTRGVGLATWEKVGTLARELALYQRLRERGVETVLFAYDRAGVDELLEPLKDFGHVPVDSSSLTGCFRFFRRRRYRLRRALADIDLIKTNQFLGGREAGAACSFHHTPLIARAGYVPSFNARSEGRPAKEIRAIMAEERELLARADAVIVTTALLRDYLREEYRVRSEKIRVIGNYVPDYCRPTGPRVIREDRAFRVLTVGRHHPEKDFGMLLKREMPEVQWRAIGAGPELESDRLLAAALKVPAAFTGRLAHHLIPAEMRATDAFVLCSQYEGHPKALLEAMACGCACVVAEAPGVDAVVTPEVTGLVVPRDPEALRAALQRLRQDQALGRRLGAAAAEHIREHYSLDRIATAEASLYQETRQR